MTLKARITAVDRFIKGCKEDGIYDDLNACCVMAGWDSLAGALTPLKGAAPTNSGLSAYDRGIGIAGDGTNYLDSNRANNADGRDDQHMGVYITSPNMQNVGIYIGSDPSSTVGANQISVVGTLSPGALFSYSRIVSGPEYDATEGEADQIGLSAISRSESGSYYLRTTGQSLQKTRTSATRSSSDIFVFDRGPSGGAAPTDATISFYSIGSSLGPDPATGLAALDARVSTLMADLRAIEEKGFDRDALAYIRAVEEADGAYLETDVKVAINNLVAGLKADGLWDAIGSSCLLCGPRTLAGALVPLRGDAPTAEGGWASGDYDRATGLTGDPTASLYLDSNRANDADSQDSKHIAFYAADDAASGVGYMGSLTRSPTVVPTQLYSGTGVVRGYVNNGVETTRSYSGGFAGTQRLDKSTVETRADGVTLQASTTSSGGNSYNTFVFCRNDDGTPGAFANSTMAFYSIGSSLDLAKLDTNVTAYVTAIGAAL